MEPQVIAFAGAIASGKTTLAEAVASALGCQRVSFGSFVREEATRRGLDANSRDVLQAIGEDLIARGWEPFCLGVLAQAGWRPHQMLVVDGIRHTQALETIRRLVWPLRTTLIYVDVAHANRDARLRVRGVDEEDQARADSHSTEAEVPSQLPAVADHRLHADGSVAELVERVLAWL